MRVGLSMLEAREVEMIEAALLSAMPASLDLQAPLQDSVFRDRRLNRKSDGWESANTV
jgi:hypothetical protein